MDIHEYFRLKHAYESKLDQKKKAIRDDQSLGTREKRQKFEMTKRECVNCKKEGGTTFRSDKTHHYMKCAATPPCELDVQVARNTVTNVRKEERQLEEKVNRIKNEIIETNMDLLYKFADEDATLKRSEALRKDLQATSDELVVLRKGLERNSTKLTEVEQALQREVDALKNAEATEYKGSTERYVALVRPLLEQIRALKYSHIAVEQPDDKSGISYLVQNAHTMEDYYR